VSIKYSGEQQKSDGSVITNVKKLFRNIFFNEYEEFHTFIIAKPLKLIHFYSLSQHGPQKYGYTFQSLVILLVSSLSPHKF